MLSSHFPQTPSSRGKHHKENLVSENYRFQQDHYENQSARLKPSPRTIHEGVALMLLSTDIVGAADAVGPARVVVP